MSYSIFARRMYKLVRRYTPLVEEYSIDECFADITDVLLPPYTSHADLARTIKSDLEMHLGITFGVGLGPNKIIAKIASKHHKPAGFTHITRDSLDDFLRDMPIGKLWGVGSSMSIFFNRLGIKTAFEFSQQSLEWIRANHISKPYREMWYELQGYFIRPIVHRVALEEIGSIMKTRTFTPPSRDRSFIFSQLSKNVERACEKARLHRVEARELSIYLKTQEFTYSYAYLTLPIPTTDAMDIIRHIAPLFATLYVPGVKYRATGISLRSLQKPHTKIHDLFGEMRRHESVAPLLRSIDEINHRYGTTSIHLASSMQALLHNEKPYRKNLTGRFDSLMMPSVFRKKTIDIPFLGIAH